MAMTIKNEREIQRMEAAGHVVALVHAAIERELTPGLTTADLDEIARNVLAEQGAVSSFLGYHGYPAHICTSVNDEIVHGIPGRRRLCEGDIVSVDVGAILEGFHGDSAWTYGVGAISDEAAALLRDTEEALNRAVAAAVSNHRLGAIGHAVEAFARSRQRGVVKDYGGHGIGRQMHEDPHVPNIGRPDRGVLMRTGLTLAIEPMLTTGTEETRTLGDNWTVVTADGSLAAHFEHTVAVSPEGGRVLTRRLSSVLE
ncbi:MAG: type I methionyl aminopeptidase [Thermomicrobiales bacterium]|nr:type I methionyl aminopeptidase [Thermomicrobiales bacterium]